MKKKLLISLTCFAIAFLMLPVIPLMDKYGIDPIFKPKFDFGKEGAVIVLNEGEINIVKESTMAQLDEAVNENNIIHGLAK